MIKKRSSSLTTRLLIKTTDFSHRETVFVWREEIGIPPPFYLHLAIDTTEILSQRVFKRKMRDNCVLPKRLGYNHQRLWQKDRWEAISSFVAVVYWMLTLKDAKTGFASKQDEENISKYKQALQRRTEVSEKLPERKEQSEKETV